MTNVSLPSAPLLVGKSPIVERLRHEIDSAARADAAVLIEGETGVGKDVAARLIYSKGRRRAQRFVAAKDQPNQAAGQGATYCSRCRTGPGPCARLANP